MAKNVLLLTGCLLAGIKPVMCALYKLFLDFLNFNINLRHLS